MAAAHRPHFPTLFSATPHTISVTLRLAVLLGRWASDEHEAFLAGYLEFGKDWKQIQQRVKVRTLVQVRTHAQKWLLKNPDRQTVRPAPAVSTAQAAVVKSVKATSAPARRKRKAETAAVPSRARAVKVVPKPRAAPQPKVAALKPKVAASPANVASPSRLITCDDDPAFMAEVVAAKRAARANFASKAMVFPRLPSSPESPGRNQEVADFCLPDTLWFGVAGSSSSANKASPDMHYKAPHATSPVSIIAPELSDILNFLDPDLGGASRACARSDRRCCGSAYPLLRSCSPPSSFSLSPPPATDASASAAAQHHHGLVGKTSSLLAHPHRILPYPAPIRVQDVHDPDSPRASASKWAKTNARAAPTQHAPTITGTDLYQLLEW